jgi:hypothetical protein
MDNTASILNFMVLSFVSEIVIASNSPCEFIKSKNAPVVILLNKNGEMVKGPIDLGSLAFPSAFQAEFYKIPTEYKLVAYPRTLFFQSAISGTGYVDVERSKQICPNASTFKINVHMNFSKGDTRPYKFEYLLPDVMMQDLPTTPMCEANEIFYFKPKISGLIIQSSK